MKKLLILLIPVLVASAAANGQSLQGYYWYFNNAAPFTSVAGAAGSVTSYTLTTVGTGTVTAPVSQDLSGLGSASCPGLFKVAKYAVASGLEFSNSPQLVTDSYTIEMVVNVASIPGYVRLLGFSPITQDAGIYINSDATGLYFWDGAVAKTVSFPISANTWYDIVFTRNGTTNDIRVYVNGVLKPEVIHDANGVFKPKPSYSNRIRFLKDDNSSPNEETNGLLAKVSIFNQEFSQARVTTLYNEVCSAGLVGEAPNFSPQGYQWSFASTPYTAVGADANSSPYASNYTLSNIGSISPGAEVVGLGGSCTAGINVADFGYFSGLQFSQSPQFIDKSYTIELVFRASWFDKPFKLVDFNNSSTDAIIVDAQVDLIKRINFYNGSNNYVNFPENSDTWFSLVLTRDAGTKIIRVYWNNTLRGTFTDAGDVFVPHASNGNVISFFNDDFVGRIAKISLFNRVLNPTQLAQRLNNICNTNLIILPVTLKNFNAQKAGGKVNLSWTTATEQNSKGFEVQRSTDGTNYTAIGFVNGAGNSATDIAYHFTDASPLAGKSYYRLKQINLDNQFKLSATRLIDFAKDVQDLQVYPNPTHSMLTVVNLKAGNALRIFDPFGRFVYGKNITDTEETIPVDKLAAGVYVLQVTDGKGNKQSVRFTRF